MVTKFTLTRIRIIEGLKRLRKGDPTGYKFLGLEYESLNEITFNKKRTVENLHKRYKYSTKYKLARMFFTPLRDLRW